MTDRELLELAAKAAAVFLTPEKFAAECASPWESTMEPHYDEHSGCMVGYRTWYGSKGEIGGWEMFDWNPLTDDGDALRLAVKLRLDISPQFDDKVEVFNLAETDADFKWAWEAYGDDADAATRRAIVRAAAEIGKAMP